MCDTFVALNSRTKDGSILFGKNSDREPNEMQALEYHPRRQYASTEKVSCTYIQIAQQKETFALLIGRPYWMWGAEFGVNEFGLAMGNEAVWTRMPVRKQKALTGMDLLRLTLERSASAQQGIEVLTSLLSDYGQGGICGLYDKSMAYHNSYLLVDPKEAWVLETVDYLWVAKRVKDYYAISNGLTIGEEYDLIHKDAISTARKRGWLKSGQTFNFAECFSDWLYTTFSAQKKRRSQSNCFLLDQSEIDVHKAMSLLQSHSETEYFPDRSLLGNSICAHAANPVTRNATQTTGSIVCRFKTGQKPQYWCTATSAPCISIFKPVVLDEQINQILGPVSSTHVPSSFWWAHESLHRQVIKDYIHRRMLIEAERNKYQEQLLEEMINANGEHFAAISASSFHHHRRLIDQWLERVREQPVNRKPTLLFRRYWSRMNKKAGLLV